MVSGMIRGLGIKKFMDLELVDRLEAILAISRNKDLKDIKISKRYFIVFLLHSLWDYFGRIFEPHFPKVLPVLRQLFGDHSEDIRKLSTAALNVAMRSMSAYGVKQILPILMEGCHSDNWRTKVSNLHALGSMAHLATKQLASSLP